MRVALAALMVLSFCQFGHASSALDKLRACWNVDAVVRQNLDATVDQILAAVVVSPGRASCGRGETSDVNEIIARTALANCASIKSVATDIRKANPGITLDRFYGALATALGFVGCPEMETAAQPPPPPVAPDGAMPSCWDVQGIANRLSATNPGMDPANLYGAILKAQVMMGCRAPDAPTPAPAPTHCETRWEGYAPNQRAVTDCE